MCAYKFSVVSLLESDNNIDTLKRTMAHDDATLQEEKPAAAVSNNGRTDGQTDGPTDGHALR